MPDIIKHVAIIMDGNGRWAKKQNKARTYGHYKGTENVRNITISANDLGIKVLSVYAFSTENWQRPKSEVDYLMKLPKVFFESYLKELMENNIKVMAIGDTDKLPQLTKDIMAAAIEATKDNTGMILNFAINYGSHDEIIRAVETIIEMSKEDKYLVIDDELFGAQLYTKDLPAVDLLIRTGGEQRLSNFLLYQLAYSELIFREEAWPEFTTECFKACLEEFYQRQRRYGGL